MAHLKEQASSWVAELNTHAEHMVREHNEAMGRLREQAASKEAEFKQRMEEYSAALKAKEKEVLDLKAALTDAKEWNLREEERNRRREEELIAENGELRSQRMTFKELADEFMLKWKIVNEQKDQLTDSYHALQEEGIVLRERLRAEWTKEVEEATGQLTKHYEQTIKLVTAKAKNNQATWELLAAKLQAEVNSSKEELEAIRAQPGMDETRIRILIEKHRQHLTKKVEEALGRAGEEWAAQAAELHILRADAENRRKEGRGFYKMDEASIQNLRADLTEDYHTLVKSHTAAIEQLLEDFNDDQMMFRLEAEAYEQERLAAIQTSPPTPTEQNDEPPIEDTTDARQEGHAPAEGPPEHANTPPTIPEPVVTEVSSLEATTPPTVPKPIAPEDCSREDTTPPAPTTQPPSPTPQPDHPAPTPDPETILDILEEE